MSEVKLWHCVVLVMRIKVHHPLVSEDQNAVLVEPEILLSHCQLRVEEISEAVVVFYSSFPMALFAVGSEDLAPADYCVV